MNVKTLITFADALIKSTETFKEQILLCNTDSPERERERELGTDANVIANERIKLKLKEHPIPECTVFDVLSPAPKYKKDYYCIRNFNPIELYRVFGRCLSDQYVHSNKELVPKSLAEFKKYLPMIGIQPEKRKVEGSRNNSPVESITLDELFILDSIFHFLNPALWGPEGLYRRNKKIDKNLTKHPSNIF